VEDGRKQLARNRPSDALIAFGRALAEDPDSRAAKAGKKEAEDKLIALGKPVPKPPPAPEPEAKPRRLPTVTSPGGLVEQPPLKGHQSGTHLLAFSRDGRQLVTGSFDRSVRIWDMTTRAERKQLTDTIAPFSVATSADGRWIAAGFIDGSIRTWDAGGTPPARSRATATRSSASRSARTGRV
jgi:WD40 repeat protein